MSSSMNPPDPYGTGDQSGSTPSGDASGGSTPGYGSQPYGSTPPAYGSTPPAYGSTPPAYGSDDQGQFGSQGSYGSQPAYGTQYSGGYGAPSAYGQAGYYPKNSLAVWSLVLGIVSFVLSCGLFTGIPAIIVGHRARTAVAEGQANNGGMATAGIVLGWIATILSLLGVILVIILIATGAFAEFAANSTSTNQTF
ncbi:DUF4190 domain-containing protein [Cellulomonas aerilata]|uniref:DUF4190 domain-containing protein n=1 Tax=Cellulomonas aerilata TaxID=515326 RepID=A0A512DGU2_9CELL|nr:DUF4190 domain-containing protein [Cellulomonas aerilata]GEO35410.1 hypothetical protein CAE01nite_31350 [Cellulomonas aerilata]